MATKEYNNGVRKQNANRIYKVESKGTTIEFTDRLGEAQSAYNEAQTPKTIWLVNAATRGATKVSEKL